MPLIWTPLLDHFVCQRLAFGHLILYRMFGSMLSDWSMNILQSVFITHHVQQCAYTLKALSVSVVLSTVGCNSWREGEVLKEDLG